MNEQNASAVVQELQALVATLEKRIVSLEQKKAYKPLPVPPPKKTVLNYEALKNLSQRRFDEASALLSDGHYDSACYMAGYSIELAFKARICRVLDEDEFFERATFKDFKIHHLPDLLILSGLRRKLETDRANNGTLASHWSKVSIMWSEQLRYSVPGQISQFDAEQFFFTISNSDHTGVLQWIQQHW
jgi:HEPN domain-containing protein